MSCQEYNKTIRDASDRACLNAMPGTQQQLHAKTGISENTVRLVAARLYPSKCHIGGWHQGIKKMLPIYSAGPGFDAQKPKWQVPPKQFPARKSRANTFRTQMDSQGDIGIPLVVQAMRTPNSIWAYARQVGA